VGSVGFGRRPYVRRVVGGWGDCVSDGLIWVGSDDGFGDGKIVIGGN
jgi:hypothetical protein